MRTKRFGVLPTKIKVGVMTGGVKENKSQLQLNMGELVRGVNYHEVDGVYSGYMSFPGYERTDGTSLASSIPVPILEDKGVDRFTTLLVEGVQEEIADLSREGVVVTNNNSVVATTYENYSLDFQYSYFFPESSSLTFPSKNFDVNNFCVEAIIKITSLASDNILYQAGTDIVFYIEETSGAVKLDLNDSDVTHTFNSIVSIGDWYHISLRRNSDKVYLELNGSEDTSYLVLGSSSYDILNVTTTATIAISGYLNQYRISEKTYRRAYEYFEEYGVPYSNSSYNYVFYEDASREARRTAIKKIGDTSCAGSALGGYDFNGVIYAVRNNAAETSDTIWKTTSSGWDELSYPTVIRFTSGNKNSGTEFVVGETLTGSVSSATGVIKAINQEGGSWASGTATGLILLTSISGTFSDLDIISTSVGATSACDVSTFTLAANGNYKFIEGSFDLFTGLQRQRVLFFTSGKSYPCYITSDTIYPILYPELPDNIASGIFATASAEFKNRLWLGYPDGRLVFSNVGDPLDFDSSTFSGTIYLEDGVLDLVPGAGDSMFVFCNNSIQIIKALTTTSATDQVITDYLFSTSNLITGTRVIENTALRMFDDIIYIDDRGLTSISATDAYGDFTTKSYAKNIQRTFLANLDNIVGAVVNREYNQYRVFFNTGVGAVFTFEMRSIANSMTTLVKGATFFQYTTTPTFVAEGIFGDDEGFVYLIDSGTSFDGDEIVSNLSTAYYSYNSPTFIKHFKEAFFEGYIPYNTDISIKANFDYRDYNISPSGEEDSVFLDSGVGGVYGSGVYGSIRYGSSEYQSSIFYISGYGSNVSFVLSSTNKYNEPHILSNIIVQYSLNGRMM